MTIEIPVRGDLPSYDFTIELEGVLFTLRFRWNERMAIWIMTVGDEQGVDILCGIPLYTSVNIMGHYRNPLLPPGVFLVYDETGRVRDADRETFGTEVKLLYEESVG